MATQQVEVRVVDKTARSLGNISKRLQGLNKGLLGINRVAGLAAGALATIGGGITLRRIIRVSAEFQDLRTTLTSVTGSAQDGARAFDFITKFATETQFSTQQLTTSFIKLKTAGIEPTRELLETFTDAAAVTTDQIGTLQAITDLFARTTAGGLGLEEINRLTDRGLPALDILQEKLGLNRLQISEFGKSAEGARIITEALAEGIRERFGGATAARLNNLSVQFSNLSIAIDNAADKVGRGGLNAALGDLTKRITDTITQNDELADSLGRKLALATVLLGDALAFAVKNIDILAIAALSFIGLKIGLAVTSLALAFGSTLFKGIGFAITAFRKLRVAAAATKISLATLLGPISLIAFGLAELVANSDKVKKAFGDNADAIDNTNDKLDDNSSFVDKATNALKNYTGVDLPGYLKEANERVDQLQANQEKMNEATDKFNELKKTGSVIDQEEINRLKQKPKTFAEILVAQTKLRNDAEIALVTDKEKAAILQVQKDLGRELSQIEKDKLLPLIAQRVELQKTLELQQEASTLVKDALKGTFTGLKLEEQRLRKIQELAIKEIEASTATEKSKAEQKLLVIEDTNLKILDLMDALNQETSNRAIDQYKRELTKKLELEKAFGKEKGTVGKVISREEILQNKGRQERIQEAVQKRVEFEKKSDLEKTQFGLEQGVKLFTGLSAVNKKFFALQKASAIALAIVNTYQGATKALATYPPPFNFIAAAATVASGLAQVATIRSQTYQRGGNPVTNQPAIVGEGGPELIVPRQPSTVIPNEVTRTLMGMQGGPVNVNFNINTVDASGIDELLVDRRSTIVGIINQAMNQRGRQGVTT